MTSGTVPVWTVKNERLPSLYRSFTSPLPVLYRSFTGPLPALYRSFTVSFIQTRSFTIPFIRNPFLSMEPFPSRSFLMKRLATEGTERLKERFRFNPEATERLKERFRFRPEKETVQCCSAANARPTFSLRLLAS